MELLHPKNITQETPLTISEIEGYLEEGVVLMHNVDFEMYLKSYGKTSEEFLLDDSYQVFKITQ